MLTREWFLQYGSLWNGIQCELAMNSFRFSLTQPLEASFEKRDFITIVQRKRKCGRIERVPIAI